MSDDKYLSAYDKHWQRLAELLGPSEAAAERARMTVDERADRLHKRIQDYKKRQLPYLRACLASAEADNRAAYAMKLCKQIAYREQAIRDYEAKS